MTGLPGRRAAGTSAARGTNDIVVILPGLVDDVAILANVAVNGSEDDVAAANVLGLLGLVDGLSVADVALADDGDVVAATLAAAGLGDVDSLAVTVLTGVGLEDVDDAATRASGKVEAAVLGEAPAVEALVDGGDGSSLGGGRAGKGGDKGGGQGQLVSDGGGDDIGDKDASAGAAELSRDVDGQEDAVGNVLAGLDAAAARGGSVTTAVLRVIARALNITQTRVDNAGAGSINFITAVAVTVMC